MTRAQIVTFLFRLSGLLDGPVTGGGLGSDAFVDVSAGHWADEEVGWAVVNGVTVGVGEGRFDLDRVVTRAQIATFLYRVNLLVLEVREVRVKLVTLLEGVSDGSLAFEEIVLPEIAAVVDLTPGLLTGTRLVPVPTSIVVVEDSAGLVFKVVSPGEEVRYFLGLFERRDDRWWLVVTISLPAR